MTSRRWWLLAVAAAALISVLVLAVSIGVGVRLGIGVAILVAFVAFWAIVFRPDCEGTPRALLVLVVTIVATGALTCVATELAYFQTIAFPVAWTVLTSTRRSILASAAIALVVWFAFFVRLGF